MSQTGHQALLLHDAAASVRPHGGPLTQHRQGSHAAPKKLQQRLLDGFDEVHWTFVNDQLSSSALTGNNAVLRVRWAGAEQAVTTLETAHAAASNSHLMQPVVASPAAFARGSVVLVLPPVGTAVQRPAGVAGLTGFRHLCRQIELELAGPTHWHLLPGKHDSWACATRIAGKLSGVHSPDAQVVKRTAYVCCGRTVGCMVG